jgi:hypothetical protein
MEAESQRPSEREGATSALNAAIEAMNLAKELSGITPAEAAFGSASVILAGCFCCLFTIGRLQAEIHPVRHDLPDGLR